MKEFSEQSKDLAEEIFLTKGIEKVSLEWSERCPLTTLLSFVDFDTFEFLLKYILASLGKKSEFESG
ncbi:hypothetical protein LEP1GSC043_3770 [Leptospira weilii str. Ecochallenge]|uniref:Uncharacterized protein n=1 Tax=Leptospira weilii str. Ecochallenge TaxID=1049986 RepID=N1UHH0_9LEPT|nr:hypothetical protein LEP1GSC043_3770 [Leptospira weilii str. Ecochallenge]